MRYLTVRYLLVTMRILTVRPRDPLVGGGVKFFYQETSLGHHEISHGEISPGYQENLLVNKFPVFTVRKNIFMLENVQCVALEFLFNPQTLMCVTPL